MFSICVLEFVAESTQMCATGKGTRSAYKRKLSVSTSNILLRTYDQDAEKSAQRVKPGRGRNVSNDNTPNDVTTSKSHVAQAKSAKRNSSKSLLMENKPSSNTESDSYTDSKGKSKKKAKLSVSEIIVELSKTEELVQLSGTEVPLSRSRRKTAQKTTSTSNQTSREINPYVFVHKLPLNVTNQVSTWYSLQCVLKPREYCLYGSSY